jgi:hypothetical protein
MSNTVIHIEIYLLNLNSNNPRTKYKCSYEIEDNDENILFSPFMFRECIRDYCKDQKTIIGITPNDLCQRLYAFELQTRPPAYIQSKIKNIIKYIEKNQFYSYNLSLCVFLFASCSLFSIFTSPTTCYFSLMHQPYELKNTLEHPFIS